MTVTVPAVWLLVTSAFDPSGVIATSAPLPELPTGTFTAVGVSVTPVRALR